LWVGGETCSLHTSFANHKYFLHKWRCLVPHLHLEFDLMERCTAWSSWARVPWLLVGGIHLMKFLRHVACEQQHAYWDTHKN
jgi:hypothetical protein